MRTAITGPAQHFPSLRRAAFLMGMVLLASACSLAPASAPPTFSGNPTAAFETATPTMTATATETPLPTLTPSPTIPAETPTPTRTPAPTACPPESCIYSQAFPLLRPIAAPGRDTPDRSYPYGSTQEKQRDPHHGVELLNSQGTPVLAAADGAVEVAGDDRTTFYGPYSYFYGNLIVIRHALPGFEEPVFTLYGHLSEIHVQVGQQVHAGDEIGLVGMSGVATGSHLHFEVRYGENLYQRTSNPELWLQPHTNQQGTLNGGMAGRVLDYAGAPAAVESVVLVRLSGPGGSSLGEIYPQAYEEKALLGGAPFGESFAAGDLEPGWYQVSFAYQGLQSREFEVLPGMLTVLTFQPSSATP